MVLFIALARLFGIRYICWNTGYSKIFIHFCKIQKNNKKRNAKVTAAAEGGWEGVGRGGRRRACTPGWAGRRRRRRTGSQSTRLIVAGTGQSPCCSPGSGPAPGDRTSGPGIPASREKKREILCRMIQNKNISSSSWVVVFPSSFLLLDDKTYYKQSRVGRVLSFFCSRRNWDSPTPSPAGECAPTLWFGGAHSLAAEGVGDPIPTRGHTL